MCIFFPLQQMHMGRATKLRALGNCSNFTKEFGGKMTLFSMQAWRWVGGIKHSSAFLWLCGSGEDWKYKQWLNARVYQSPLGQNHLFVFAEIGVINPSCSFQSCENVKGEMSPPETDFRAHDPSKIPLFVFLAFLQGSTCPCNEWLVYTEGWFSTW